MKKIQVKRWREFAKAMCFGGFPEITERRKERLWEEASYFIEAYKDEPVDGWDNDYCLCDVFCEEFSEYEDSITDKSTDWWFVKENPRYFANQLQCVVRASVNAAVGDGAGVMGWSVGDLKVMFGGKIPAWLACQYKGCLVDAPDERGVWL